MAGKKLFTDDLPAATDRYYGPVPAGKEWSFTASFCNRTTAPINVRLAICAANPAVASEYYEYDAKVDPYPPLERTGLVAPAGYYVMARASASGISLNGHGYEE